MHWAGKVKAKATFVERSRSSVVMTAKFKMLAEIRRLGLNSAFH